MNNYYDGDTVKYDKTKEMKMEGGATNTCCCPQPQYGCTCNPIFECPQERVCHRYINYEVPQV